MKRSLILGMIVFCCCAAFAEFAAYPMAAYGTDTDYVIGANCSLRFRPTAADTSSTKSTLDLQMRNTSFSYYSSLNFTLMQTRLKPPAN